MASLNDHLSKMDKAISQGNTPTSSNTESVESGLCRICGGESICDSLGVIRYDVPYGDPRFGKIFRCPNNNVEVDADRQERLRRLSNLNTYKDKGFHNFIVNGATLKPAEAESLSAALTGASHFALNPHGWLLLEGTFGCGKTHLAAAVGNLRLQKGDAVLFITVPDLLDHLRSTFGPSSETGYDETFDRIRNAPVLILDDLGAENASAWAQEKLFQLLNHRYGHRSTTVVTTNTDLGTLDPRIGSRLLDSELVRHIKINAPDYRTYVRTNDDQFQLSSLGLYRDMTFESFDTHNKLLADERSNAERALKIAKAYARQPEGWLLLTGSYGSGKTHLAAAIANEVVEQRIDVMFITVPDLLDYLRVTYSPNAPVSFDQRFQMVRNAPFLVLDDLGTESSTPWAKEKLFQIIDHRYVTRRPTVITTGKHIDNLDERVRTRLLDKRRCTMFAITGPDYASRLKRNK